MIKEDPDSATVAITQLVLWVRHSLPSGTRKPLKDTNRCFIQGIAVLSQAIAGSFTPEDGHKVLKSEGAMAPRLASLTVIILGMLHQPSLYLSELKLRLWPLYDRRRTKRHLPDTTKQHELPWIEQNDGRAVAHVSSIFTFGITRLYLTFDILIACSSYCTLSGSSTSMVSYPDLPV